MYKDLFEVLRIHVGCDYISDLQYGENNRSAKEFMTTVDLSQWPLDILSDVAEYLFRKKQKFDSFDQARLFFMTSVSHTIDEYADSKASCSHCKTGAYTYKLDPLEWACPHISGFKDGQCAYFIKF